MKIKYAIFLLSFCFMSSVIAQDKEAKEGASAAQANNPLANMTALNFHNYLTPIVANAPSDAYMNTSWIRFAKPFAKGKLLLRASAPISTIGMPDAKTGTVNATNGLGDINAFMSYNFISKPSATVGIGPLLTAPTAAHDLLGAGKWQAGLAFVAYIIQSPTFQVGGLVTWQTSIAGDQDRPKTNSAAVQPFYFWQLGNGTYLRGVPVWYFDFENDVYNTPIALGIGKIVKVGNTVFNLFLEPQYSVLVKGTQPQFQLFMGINLQFVKN